MHGKIKWLEYEVELDGEDEVYGPDYRGTVYGQDEVWYECHAYTPEMAERECIEAIEAILNGGDPYVDTAGHHAIRKESSMKKCAEIYNHRGVTYETFYDNCWGWCYSFDVDIDGEKETYAKGGYTTESGAAWAGMARVDTFLQTHDLIVDGGVDAYASRKASSRNRKCAGNLQVGDTIRIVEMDGEPQYSGKVGVVEYIDDIGQIHGTWGGCAIIPEVDVFEVVKSSRRHAIR